MEPTREAGVGSSWRPSVKSQRRPLAADKEQEEDRYRTQRDLSVACDRLEEKKALCMDSKGWGE